MALVRFLIRRQPSHPPLPVELKGMTGTHSRFAALRFVLIGTGLAGALLLHACGGDDAALAPASDTVTQPAAAPSASSSSASVAKATGAASSGGAIDGCKLLTKSDAANALGEPVKDGEGETSGARIKSWSCTYVSEGNYGAHVVFFTLGKGPEQKSVFDLAHQTYRDAQDLKGVGDQAFVVVLGGPVAQVHVRKGESYFIVALTQIPENGRPEQAKELAKLIAGKL